MAHQGQPHASLVMSSRVTSAFSNLCLSNLWHYGELCAVAMPANKLYSCTEHCFPLMLRENTSTSIWRPRCVNTSHNISCNSRVCILLCDGIGLFCHQPSSRLLPVGSMRGQLMKVWLEQSCYCRSKRRRCSGSRPTWPTGCPGPTSTQQMTHWPRVALPCLTFETLSTLLQYLFANPRFLLQMFRHSLD